MFSPDRVSRRELAGQAYAGAGSPVPVWSRGCCPGRSRVSGRDRARGPVCSGPQQQQQQGGNTSAPGGLQSLQGQQQDAAVLLHIPSTKPLPGRPMVR